MGRAAKVKAATRAARKVGSVTFAAIDRSFPNLRRRTLRRIEKRIAVIGQMPVRSARIERR